jgi:metacaspase-1
MTTPVRPRGLRRALFIGINYIGSQYELAGCVNDSMNMFNHIGRLYPACKEVRLLRDNGALKPTKQNIMESIRWLISGLKPGENAIFHYSGHGGLVRDKNGDEVSGYDSCIYPCDNGKLEEITDDELRSALADGIPAGSKCFVILDCCHSGSAVDLRYRLNVPNSNVVQVLENKVYPKTRGQVVFLSGCTDFQFAADTVNAVGIPCGALTWALLETWKRYGTKIKLKYLLWDILQFLRTRGYPQTPQLSLGQYFDINAIFDLAA